MHPLIAPLALITLITSTTISQQQQQPSTPTPTANQLTRADNLHPITQRNITLHDTQRDKDLPLRVIYPTNLQPDTPTPTIIFSHGAGGAGTNYDPLALHWATQGYIVLLPTHSDSITTNAPTTSGRPFIQRLHNRKTARAKRNARLGPDFDFTDWPNRPRDISFVIDSVSTIESIIPDLAGRIDPNRIGVGGHSYGAFTAQLIAGTDPIGPGNFTDSRSRCQLLISPQGSGGLLNNTSWNTFTGPSFTITGDNDTGRNGEPATWRREPFDNSPPNTHTLLWIDDAYHNFGGIAGQVLPLPDQGPENPTHVQIVQTATLAFWDHHLRNESQDIPAFADTLESQLESQAVSIEHN
ncbi:MAG: alpha/beta hydrolase family protein [Phycisphaerales bacterium]